MIGLIIPDASELLIVAVLVGDVDSVDDGTLVGPGYSRWTALVHADSWRQAAVQAVQDWHAANADPIDASPVRTS